MKAIICGAGQVGTSIAKQLVLEENDVTVIDQSHGLIDKINNSLEVKTCVGFASHPTVLEKAGAADADMIIAVTQSDEINMIACQVAGTIFGVRKKIARIRNQNYFTQGVEKFFTQGNTLIDVIISPEIEVGKAILDRMHVPGAIETILFADGKIKAISVKPTEDCRLIGKTIEEANELIKDLRAKFIAIVRDEDLHTIESDIAIDAEDELYSVTYIEDLRELMARCGHEEKEARKVRIVGGGRVGMYIAEQLETEEDVQVKIIEHNEKRANIIAERLSDTTVINGDALDQEILKEVNISTTDSVITVSNDDEVNILSALLSKKLGCEKAIALVNSNSLAPLFSSLGLDIVVNPREITVSSILRHIRAVKVRDVHSICHSQAEILETDAFESSYSVGKTITDLALPDGIIVCLIIRGEEMIVPKDETEIIADDRLIIFSRVEMIKKVEKIFSDKFKYF